MARFKSAWLNWRKLVVDDRQLSFGAKSIALYLNTYMNDSHDMAFPSLERIRGELNIGSNTTLIKYLDELERLGYLNRQKRFSKTTIYHAVVPPKISSITESVVLQNMDNSITESETPVLQNLESNKQENKQNNKQNSSKTPFGDFWNVYPRKENKKKTEVAWRRLSEKNRKMAIQDCQTRYKDTDKQFIPLPSTYINGERWNDEMTCFVKKLSLPRNDEQLLSFAKSNGLPCANPGESFGQYRHRLSLEIENTR